MMCSASYCLFSIFSQGNFYSILMSSSSLSRKLFFRNCLSNLVICLLSCISWKKRNMLLVWKTTEAFLLPPCITLLCLQTSSFSRERSEPKVELGLFGGFSLRGKSRGPSAREVKVLEKFMPFVGF